MHVVHSDKQQISLFGSTIQAYLKRSSSKKCDSLSPWKDRSLSVLYSILMPSFLALQFRISWLRLLGIAGMIPGSVKAQHLISLSKFKMFAAQSISTNMPPTMPNNCMFLIIKKCGELWFQKMREKITYVKTPTYALGRKINIAAMKEQ